MSLPAQADALREEIVARIRAGTAAPLEDEEFERLASRVFARQFAANRPYRAYCESRGVTPANVEHWTEIPAVPTSAFKVVPLICGEPEDAVAVFRTSGTTAGAARRGTHYLPDLRPYDAALRAGFAAHLLPDGARPVMFSLVPPREAAPDSSLSHMIAEVMEAFGAPGSDYFLDGGIATEQFFEAAERAATTEVPVCVLATSFALVHLLDALAAREVRLELPAGSRLMDTGGFKGRGREVARDELYREIGRRLGVPLEWCVNEYGMTEMGSQFYDTVAGEPAGAELAARRHVGPPWVRTRAVDPETLALLPDGELGILRHWDLANVGSVMVLQTEDLGVTDGGAFRLLGRSADAEPRGCSIAMDELLGALGRAG